MSWQLYTAISVLALSVCVILQRILIYKDKLDPIAYAIFFQALVAAVIAVPVLVVGFSLPNIGHYIVPAVGTILLFSVGHIMYAKTLQRVEASVFSIYFATHAIWIALCGVLLLEERLTMVQFAGAILIFASVGLAVKSIRNFKPDTGTLLGLLTGFIFGFAIAGWSYVGRHTDALSWTAISFAATAFVTLLWNPKTITKIRPMLFRRVFPKLALLAVLYAIGSITMLGAYKTGAFSIVSPLRQTSIIVTVILALLFLPAERVRLGRKIAATIACMVGALLLLV